MIRTEARSENLTGIFLMLAAMALFAVEDLFAEMGLGRAAAWPDRADFRRAWGPGLHGDGWRGQRARIFVKDALHPAVMARNIGEMIGTASFVAALATLPLGTGGGESCRRCRWR